MMDGASDEGKADALGAGDGTIPGVKESTTPGVDDGMIPGMNADGWTALDATSDGARLEIMGEFAGTGTTTIGVLDCGDGELLAMGTGTT